MIWEGLLYQQTLHLTLPVPALEALPTCLESLSLGLFACLISAWSTSPNFCLPRPLRSQFNLHNLREESLICLAITAHCTAVSTTVISQVYLLQGASRWNHSACVFACFFSFALTRIYIHILIYMKNTYFLCLGKRTCQSLAIKTTMIKGI